MENAIGCIVGNAYTSMLSSTGRHLSSAIWGKLVVLLLVQLQERVSLIVLSKVRR